MKMEEYLLYNTEVLRLHSMPVHSSHDNDEVHLHQKFQRWNRYSRNKTTYQIPPGSSLVVSGIPFWETTAVDWMIIFVISRKRAESRAGNKFTFHSGNDCFCLAFRQYRIWK